MRKSKPIIEEEEPQAVVLENLSQSVRQARIRYLLWHPSSTTAFTSPAMKHTFTFTFITPTLTQVSPGLTLRLCSWKQQHRNSVQCSCGNTHMTAQHISFLCHTTCSVLRPSSQQNSDPRAKSDRNYFSILHHSKTLSLLSLSNWPF